MDEANQKKSQRFVRIKRQENTERSVPTPSAPEQPTTEPLPRPPESEAHTRIVVPRHERRTQADLADSNADVELREVRYGVTSRLPYLRVVPKQRKLVRVAPGHIQATALGSRPVDVVGGYWADIKRVVIGSPYATSQAIHERLSKVKAMSILGSDPLSSSAYATEEALIVLAVAGSAALSYALPIAGVIAALLVIVTLSYRQTQRAYPNGGGAYIVAHENLGRRPGLTAAAALLVDYVLLVSVSVAAGVAAITSAAPVLHDLRVPIGVAVIAFFTLGNLRGIRESGTLFAAPTYFFIISMAVVIVVGVVKVALGEAPGSLLENGPPREEVVVTQGLTMWLILRAFSSGGAALTGVEAMSNAVPNFKPPESRNAQTTLTAMAGIAIFLFVGITFLSSRYGLVPSEEETIVSMLGREVLGENFLYYAYQATTAMILFLAANTSFNAFPLLSAILARDGYMPRQFTFKGDRLAYSNGILMLAATASLLLAVFGGEVTRLIPLYAVGVFVSFTLSQSGMVKHWWKLRESSWRTSLVINGVGAIATAVVAVIITATKFTHGAWISIIIMFVLIVIFALIRRHYDWFEVKLHMAGRPTLNLPPSQVEGIQAGEHIVVPVDGINRVSTAAIAFAKSLSTKVTAAYITDDAEQGEEFRLRWQSSIPDVPLMVIESPYRALVVPILAYIESLEASDPNTSVTVVLPRFVTSHWWERFLHNQDILRLKSYLNKRSKETRVVELPYHLGDELVINP